LTHQYPDTMGVVARSMLAWFSHPFYYLLDKLAILPSNLLQQLSRI